MVLGRHGRAAAAEAARREAVGEPVVRDRSRQSLRWAWTFVCPFPNDLSCGGGSLHDGFETADHCRAGWIAHARQRHPGRPIGWPAGIPGVEPAPFAGAQVVAAPRYVDGVVALRDVGALVNMAGQPIFPVACSSCRRHQTLGETCPLALPCSLHRAAVGRPCRRPSEHQVPSGWCGARAAAAALVDRQRELAGDPAVPAPWPEELAARQNAEAAGDPVQGALFGVDAAGPVRTRPGLRRQRGRNAVEAAAAAWAARTAVVGARAAVHGLTARLDPPHDGAEAGWGGA